MTSPRSIQRRAQRSLMARAAEYVEPPKNVSITEQVRYDERQKVTAHFIRMMELADDQRTADILLGRIDEVITARAGYRADLRSERLKALSQDLALVGTQHHNRAVELGATAEYRAEWMRLIATAQDAVTLTLAGQIEEALQKLDEIIAIRAAVPHPAENANFGGHPTKPENELIGRLAWKYRDQGKSWGESATGVKKEVAEHRKDGDDWITADKELSKRKGARLEDYVKKAAQRQKPAGT